MKKSNELFQLEYKHYGVCATVFHNDGTFEYIKFIGYTRKRDIIDILRRQYDCMVPARALKR